MNSNETNTKQRKLLLPVLDRGFMVAFIVPQVYTAVAYTRLADILEDPIEVRVVDK